MSRGRAALRNALLLEPALLAGEFSIETPLAERIAINKGLGPREAGRPCITAAAALSLDFLGVCPEPLAPGWDGLTSLEDARLALRAGLGLVGLVTGGFTRLCREWGLGETLSLCKNRPAEARETILCLDREALIAARNALSWGCDLLVLAEDIAYDRGLYAHRLSLKEVLYPSLSWFTEACDAPVVFHSDGDISEILGDISEMGFIGFHSLETSGRMSPAFARDNTGGSMFLMGGLPHKVLLGMTDNARQRSMELIQSMQGVPFAFGSSSGVLDQSCSEHAVVASYDAFRSGTIGLDG